MSKDIVIPIEGSDSDLHVKRIKNDTNIEISIVSWKKDKNVHAQTSVDPDLLIPLSDAIIRAHKLLTLL